MKYLIVLALIIALPIYLYLKEEPVEPEDPHFPLEIIHSTEGGSIHEITILAHSKNYIQFIDEENSQFKGKLMTHILNKSDFSETIKSQVSEYPEDLEAPTYPCVIKMTLKDDSSFYANLIGKNTELAYYTRDYKDVEDSIKLTELNQETRRLLHYFPSNRKPEPKPKIELKVEPEPEPEPEPKAVTLPYSGTVSSSAGKIVNLTIHKRVQNGIIVSIKDRYNVHQIPFNKLSDDSQELVSRLPIDHEYSYDLTDIRERYSFIKQRLDEKLKEQRKFGEGTLKYNSLDRDIEKIKVKLSEVTTQIEDFTS